MLTDLLNQLQPWLAWMHAHPQWVAIATFFIAFIECLALVGFIVPGTVIMTAIGALVGSDIVPAHIVFIPAIIGAICGDAISFFIGYHYHERLRELWPFKFYPRLLQKGESFFYRHGGKGIIAGRFIGPIRPILPLITGMLNMPPVRFFVADIISAIFWAPLYMLPGILLGAASVELPPNVAMHFMLYVILALLVLWCISWLIKRLIAWVFYTIHAALDEIWAVIKHKPLLYPFNVALQDPSHPESHAQLTLGLYFIFTLGFFILVALNVMHHATLTMWNYPLYFLLRSIRNDPTDHVMVVITLLSDPKVWIGVSVVVLLWLCWQRAWRTAVHWFLLGLLCLVGGALFKNGIQSPRPTGLMAAFSGYSFPSGHTTMSTGIAGFFAVLLSRELKRANRWVPYTVMTIFVLTIAFSRLYLGVHWLTDVLGGLLLAFASIMLMTLSYRRQITPHIKPYAFALVFSLSWLVIGSLYTVTHYQKASYEYALFVPYQTVSMAEWWRENGVQEPLYRLNRTGKPTQVLNVQWAGDIAEIEADLLLRGWATAPNNLLNLLVDRIAKQSKRLELPVLPQLYLEQRPVLVMSKELSPHTLIVLSLWDAHTMFTDSDLPLWLGNITYYHSWQTGFFHLHPRDIILPQQSVVASLIGDLQNYTWKQISYNPLPQQNGQRSWWDGQLLMIQPTKEENE
jgi:membrane protein DedA with SNARE-associated domain/membrane-associated phospholipid phosphatase